MNDIATLSGVIEHLIFQNSENGYTVGVLQYSNEKITFCGFAPSIRPGQEVSFEGTWTTHPKFGKQFQLSRVSVELPTSTQGLIKYLGSGVIKGIGPSYAERLVEFFGTTVLDVIEQHPERLALVPGIGEKRHAQIIAGWQEQKSLAKIMVFLQDKGISAAYARKIYQKYGDHALDVVTQKPYQLAQEVWGIGFTIADQIAKQVGILFDAPARVRAGIIHLLSQTTAQGHLYITIDKLKEQLVTLLQLHPEIHATLIKEVLTSLFYDDTIKLISTNEDHFIALSSHYGAEKAIAHHVLRIMEYPHTEFEIKPRSIGEQGVIALNEKQQQAVSSSISNAITIITGGPGTGKTTLVKQLLTLLEQQSISYLLAAPTGRAAKRMVQSTGRPSSTIHRLLEFDVSALQFTRNEQRALNTQVLIIDEASMIDTFLMLALLKAIPSSSRLVLIGDVNQLPSVGPGNILNDLIESNKIPCVRLTEIFRQAKNSLITLNAHRVNEGESLLYKTAQPSPDFLFFSLATPETIGETIEKIITSILPQYQLTPEQTALLTPMHRGLAGTQNLNTIMQGLINPHGQPTLMVHGTRFAVRDRVMQIRNNYDKFVFNGDVGIITHIAVDDHQITVDFDGTVVVYESSECEELVLAYALSIHKSQGSEYPAVIIPLFMQHYTLLARNLLYTAITRAKKLCICIGQPKAFAIAINNNTYATRQTFLKEFLTTNLTCRT